MLEYVIRWVPNEDHCLSPYQHIISVDPSNATGTQAYDIEIPLDDVILKARMNAVHSAIETIKQITSIDDEVHIHALHDTDHT